MKALVTGAAGQLGSAVVQQLLERGDAVRGTVIPDDPLRSRLDGLEIEILEGDLRDPAFVERSVEGVDAVAHTANVMGGDDLFLINTTINYRIADACSRRAPTSTVWYSSVRQFVGRVSNRHTHTHL